MTLAFEKTNNAAFTPRRRPARNVLVQGFLPRFALAASFVFIAAVVAVL